MSDTAVRIRHETRGAETVHHGVCIVPGGGTSWRSAHDLGLPCSAGDPARVAVDDRLRVVCPSGRAFEGVYAIGRCSNPILPQRFSAGTHHGAYVADLLNRNTPEEQEKQQQQQQQQQQQHLLARRAASVRQARLKSGGTGTDVVDEREQHASSSVIVGATPAMGRDRRDLNSSSGVK